MGEVDPVEQFAIGMLRKMVRHQVDKLKLWHEWLVTRLHPEVHGDHPDEQDLWRPVVHVSSALERAIDVPRENVVLAALVLLSYYLASRGTYAAAISTLIVVSWPAVRTLRMLEKKEWGEDAPCHWLFYWLLVGLWFAAESMFPSLCDFVPCYWFDKSAFFLHLQWPPDGRPELLCRPLLPLLCNWQQISTAPAEQVEPPSAAVVKTMPKAVTYPNLSVQDDQSSLAQPPPAAAHSPRQLQPQMDAAVQMVEQLFGSLIGGSSSLSRMLQQSLASTPSTTTTPPTTTTITELSEESTTQPGQSSSAGRLATEPSRQLSFEQVPSEKPLLLTNTGTCDLLFLVKTAAKGGLIRLNVTPNYGSLAAGSSARLKVACSPSANKRMDASVPQHLTIRYTPLGAKATPPADRADVINRFDNEREPPSKKQLAVNFHNSNN